MKKSFRQSLVGILAFLTFAGLGFAQEKVAKPYFEIYGVDGAITEDNPAVSISDIYSDDIYIKCATEGATIWYTLDGTEPALNTDGTPAGTTTQLTANKSFYLSDTYSDEGDHLTIKAMATKEGMTQSDIITASFYKQGEAPTAPETKVAKPYFEIYGVDGAITEDNPAVSISDIYSDDIYIKCATEGATIWYTLDGTEPALNTDGTPAGTTTQLTANKSFYLSDTYSDEGDHLTIKAMATKEGMTQSDIITASFYKQGEAPTTPEEKPASPTFNPASGEIIAGETITLTCTTTDAEIFYALNDGDFSKYENPVALNEVGTITLKAYSKKGEVQSETATTTYTVKAPAPQPTVTFNPPSGSTVKPGTEILVTVENPATVYDDPQTTVYWLGGTSLDEIQNPDRSANTSKITITKTLSAIKAAIIVGDPTDGYTLKEGEYTESSLGLAMKAFSASYIVEEPTPEPTVTFNPPSGSTVEPGTEILVTVENPATVYDDPQTTVYWLGGTSLDEIQNPDRSANTSKITITKTLSAIKAAIIVGDPTDGYTLKEGEYTESSLGLAMKAFSASYIVESAPEKPEAPVFTPKGGTVLPNSTVVIAKGTADSIFWKAGESSTVAFTKSLEDVKVTITENTVLCAFAMKEGISSDTAKVTYKVPAGPTDPTKATVRLVVNGANCPHQDRNQYQVLLDSSHTITNVFKNDLETASTMVGISADLLPRLYGEKTSTVPAGITAENATTSGVYPDDEAAVLVEPGTYDIFLLQSYYAYWSEKDILRGITRASNRTESDNYFSLDDITLEAGKSYVFNVTFDQSGAYGEILVSVDLQLSHILGENKPSCELDSIALSLAIKNVGLTTVSQYLAYCTNGKDTIKETVNNPIDAGESTVYAFTKKLELKDGQNTVLKAGIIVENETNTANNTAEYVAFKSEAGTLPLDIVPAKMLSAYAGDWSIDEKNNALVAARNATTPIFSSCFRVEEAGKYRLSYGYICGRYVEMPDGTVLVNNVDMYEVRVGKTSRPYASWQVVETDETITGSSNHNEFTPKDIVFDLPESGDYAFCIVPKRVNDQDNLKFRNMTVEMMQAAAARINSFTVNSPRIVPQDWGNANYATNVVVENRGLEKLENATLSFKVNGEEATKETFSLNLNETKTLTVNVPVQGFKKNDKFKISAEILNGSNVIGTANATPAEITVSENTAAFDYASNFIAIQGLQSTPGLLVGLFFPVVKQDTLTAITCGWAELQQDINIGIAVHKVTFNGDEAVLGAAIYEKEVRRGVESGLHTYKLPAFLLDPGFYFISVEQLGSANFALALDEHPEGGLHAYDKAEKSWRYLTNGGYPVIRAVFGSDGVLTSKDAAIAAISKPIAGGIFANNEPIVVSVRNNGSETAQIPVHVRVDNTLLESKSVSVEAYTTQEVSFTADLAATNQNRNITITAFTAMAGDEDHSNDTLRKNVLSMVPADPYRMDFESCLDFATEGLNPAWTSLSLDNSPVMPLRHVLEDHTFQYIEFPGHETDLGFIAFNPLNTEPSMVLFDHYDECRSHSGQRFGVSLAITDENSPKNDWLISPKLKMPSKNTQLSMWVKSFDRVYKESYEIWVSEGSNDPGSGDFVCLYPGEDEELIAPTEWTQVVFDLGLYNGKDIHVAIRCNSNDAPMFMVDDIVIGENADNEDAQQADLRLTVYPNPAKEMVSLLSPDAAITSVAIFNLSGNMVHQASRLNTDNYRFNASGLTSGMYFVRVNTNKGTIIQKFVIR